MRVIGLTGGIGMGKSTASGVFRRAFVPVFDADAAVHALQAKGGAAVPAIAAASPGAVVDGRVDRAALRARIQADPALLATLERILHPLVRQAERRFIAAARARRCRLAVLDIPLLFETGADRLCDLTIAVSAPRATQLRRIAARRGMSADDAARLIARQMPDATRRARADVVIPTGLSRHQGQRAIRRLLARLRDPAAVSR